MSLGYPDFRTIPIFESRGGTVYGAKNQTAVANTETSLVTVSGRGFLYQAIGLEYGIGADSSNGWKLKVDGSSFDNVDYDGGVNFGFVGLIFPKFNVVAYDILVPRFAVVGIYGISFESSLELIHDENAGNTPTIQGELYYSLLS